MLDLSVISNVGDVIGALDDLETRHLPFAMARTLTNLASEGQKEVRRELPNHFNIRNTWTAKGVRMEPATPKKLEARVFTLDWYMQDQQEGDTRRAQGRHLAIPSLEVRKGGVLSGRIEPRMKIKALLKKEATAKNRKRPAKRSKRLRAPVSFIAKMGNGKQGIFIRKFKDKRLPIVLLYSLKDSVKINPRWKFDKTLGQVTDKRMRVLFLQSMKNALATDRKGPKNSAFVDHFLEHPDVRFDAGSVMSQLTR